MNGCSIGIDANELLLPQLVQWLPPVHGALPLPSMAFDTLPPYKQRWASAACSAAAAAFGFLLARRAKAAAAVVSAVSVGARLIVSATRSVAGSDVFVANALGSGSVEEEELEAAWRGMLLVLVSVGLVHQLSTPERLPLFVRLLIWPLLLFESYLAALSSWHSSNPPLDANSGARPTTPRSEPEREGIPAATAAPATGAGRCGNRMAASPARERPAKPKDD